MRTLATQTGVEAPSADYPKGRTINNSTLWQESIVGDLYQFIQKLVIESGITENDLPDNVSNGYQLIEALDRYIRKNDRIYTEHDIAFGNYNVPNNVGILKLTNSGTTDQSVINLPDPTLQQNVNKNIFVIVECLTNGPGGDRFVIRSGITDICYREVESKWLEYISIKSNGTNWYIINQNVQGTNTYLGSWQEATSGEITSETPGRVITAENIKYRTATESIVGLVEEATQAEANNGDAGKFIDAEKFVNAFAFNTITLGATDFKDDVGNSLTIISQDLGYKRFGKHYEVFGKIVGTLVTSPVFYFEIVLSFLPSVIDNSFETPATFDALTGAPGAASCVGDGGRKTISVNIKNLNNGINAGNVELYINCHFQIV